MTLYDIWLQGNRLNKNISHYIKHLDENTIIEGSYDKITGKGIERVFTISYEETIDKSEELKDDLHKYQE